jgi:O-antigen/teichoic acid export membrane protein
MGPEVSRPRCGKAAARPAKPLPRIVGLRDAAMTTGKRSYERNVLVVLQGTLAAQLLNFVTLPILSRIFPPAAFGIFQVCQVFIVVGLAITSLRFDIAIVSARRLSELRAVIALCFSLNVLTAVIVIVPCLVAPAILFPTKPEYRMMAYLGPIWLLASGVLQTVSYVNLRDGAFRVAAFGKGTQSLANAITAATLGMAGLAAPALLLADIAGRTTAALVQLSGSNARSYLMRPSRIAWARVRIVAWRYRHYPMISTVSAMVNLAGASITPILVFAYYGAHTAGQFTLVDRSVAAVIGILAQSMSQVYMSDLARQIRDPEGDARALFRRIVKTSILIGAVPAALLCLILPFAFPLVFGQQWHLAGELGRLMYPLFLSTFVVVPVNTTLAVMGRQGLQFAWDVLRLCSISAVWATAHLLQMSAEHAVALYAAAAALNYMAYLAIADRALGKQSKASKPPGSSAAPI